MVQSAVVGQDHAQTPGREEANWVLSFFRFTWDGFHPVSPGDYSDYCSVTQNLEAWPGPSLDDGCQGTMESLA